MKLLSMLALSTVGVALSLGVAFAAPTSYTMDFQIINNSSHQVAFDPVNQAINWKCTYNTNTHVTCIETDGIKGGGNGTLQFTVDGSNPGGVPAARVDMLLDTKTFYAGNSLASPVVAKLSTTAWPKDNTPVTITFTDK